MRRPPILPLMLGLSICACSDAVDPPVDGILAVSTATSGDDPDPDGFQLRIDGVDSLALPPSGTAELDLSPGRHMVQLFGVAEHCSVTPESSVEVEIVAGRTAPLAFQVSCPRTGARITTTTTGLDLDPDGYGVMVDGGDRGAIASNGTMFIRLVPGSQTVSLAGLASNCAFEGPGTRSVTIVTAQVASIEFVVVCTAVRPPSGFIWGQVLKESGLCIRGAMVEIIEGPGMGRKSGQPDNCGAWDYDGFSFDDLPLGATVTLRATASGYQPEDREIVVPAGGGPVQFVLQPN
jgi:hypothetical protein